MKKLVALFLVLVFILLFSSCEGGKKVIIGKSNDTDVPQNSTDSDNEMSDSVENETENDTESDTENDTPDPSDKDPVDNEVQDEEEDSTIVNDDVEDSEIPDVDEVVVECTEDTECAIDGGGPCIEGFCNELGRCDIRSLPEGTVCSDGVFCNGNDECDGNGSCLPVGNDPCDGAICREENGGQCCAPGFGGVNCADCVRFVRQEGTATADGLKWSTGFGSVNEASDSAAAAIADDNGIESCEIRIKEGTYNVAATTVIGSGISIKGGFKGVGEELTVDPDLTILDGSVETMDNIFSTQNTSNISIENLTVQGNKNEGAEHNYGGGIYVGSATNILINNVKFKDNSAVGASTQNTGYEGKGGALAIIESSATVSNCSFKSNIARSGKKIRYGTSDAWAFGGAVYISYGKVVLSNCSFSDNKVEVVENGSASGGAVFAYSPVTLLVENCTFDSNISQTWGGGFRAEGGKVSIVGSNFLNNSASSNGGAVEFNNVTSTEFRNNIFSNNLAGTGGAIHFSTGSDVTMSECVFAANEATTAAAGLNVDNSECSVSRSKFISNNCKGGTECRGGGVSFDNNARGGLINSLIVKNHAKSYGGGVYVRNNSEVYILFSTIADNTTDGSSNTGSGIHNYNNSDAQILSSIIWNNTPGAQIQNNSSSSAEVEYSIIQGGWTGDGNFDTDPVFADPANGNYRPGAESDAVDNALSEPDNPDKDLDGNSRPNGAGYDMGCYEL